MAVVYFYIVPLIYRSIHRLEQRVNGSILANNNLNSNNVRMTDQINSDLAALAQKVASTR
jgi:hypothetical protein